MRRANTDLLSYTPRMENGENEEKRILLCGD